MLPKTRKQLKKTTLLKKNAEGPRNHPEITTLMKQGHQFGLFLVGAATSGGFFNQFGLSLVGAAASGAPSGYFGAADPKRAERDKVKSSRNLTSHRPSNADALPASAVASLGTTAPSLWEEFKSRTRSADTIVAVGDVPALLRAGFSGERDVDIAAVLGGRLDTCAYRTPKSIRKIMHAAE